MSDLYDLPPEERTILMSALEGPLPDRNPETVGLCLRLCSRRLLQRAGAGAVANGWRGSPHVFMLTREGWEYIKDARRRAPVRRAG